jgi:hypothetical protein
MLFSLDHALILRVMLMTIKSSVPLDSRYRVVYMLKVVYRSKEDKHVWSLFRSTSVTSLTSFALPNSFWKWCATLIIGDV